MPASSRRQTSGNSSIAASDARITSVSTSSSALVMTLAIWGQTVAAIAAPSEPCFATARSRAWIVSPAARPFGADDNAPQRQDQRRAYHYRDSNQIHRSHRSCLRQAQRSDRPAVSGRLIPKPIALHLVAAQDGRVAAFFVQVRASSRARQQVAPPSRPVAASALLPKRAPAALRALREGRV